MNRYILTLCLLLSSFVSAEDITVTWGNLIKECEEALIGGELEKARKAAITLNDIDPSDTQVMYYIVLTSVELGIPIPQWLLEQPWPNATKRDRKNYERAMKVLHGI